MLNQLQDVFKSFQRHEVQTQTPGLAFQDAWRHRKTVTHQGQDFFILSKADLIRSKHAAGRAVDLEDARLLEEPGPDGAEP